MLDADILFSAKSAADQFVFHNHLLRRESQHDTAFVPGIVCTLICGINKYPVVKRHGDRALRLQKCMLGPWCFVMLCYFIFRIGNDLVGISPDQMLMCQNISGCMDKRRILFHGVKGAEHRFQHFVIHLHKALSPFKYLRCFRRHKTDRIPEVMRGFPDRNHGIPVLLQVAHLYLPRNVLCGIDSDHAFQRLSLLRVDRQYFCPGIFGTHCAAVDHAVKIDIVRIFSGSQHLFSGIDPLDCIAYQCNAAVVRHREIFPEYSGAEKDSVDNLLIPCAPADVIADRGYHFQAGRIRVDINQAFCAHDHAGNTEAALNGAGRGKSISIHFFFSFA